MASPKQLAQAAKERGNVSFKLNTREGYEQSINEYQTAIDLDPESHVYHANLAAAYLELGRLEWKLERKLEALARALMHARSCTELAPTWVKGFTRCATAEYELDAERQRWELEKGKEHDPATDPPPEESTLPTIAAASLASCEATCRSGLALEPGNASLRSLLQNMRDKDYATDEAADRALMDPTSAAGPKADGNKAFAAKQYQAAIGHYTTALSFNPYDHVFWSNRSAAFATEDVDQPDKALRDADRCVALSPTWAKGYSRRATALYILGRYPEAEAAAKRGLELDPANVGLQQTLASAQVETRETTAVQAQMARFRADKRKNAKLRAMLSGLNLGNNVQMFGGLGGGSGFGGQSNMSETQMRQMARAMASVENGGGCSSSSSNNSNNGCSIVVNDDDDDDGIEV